MDPFTYLTEFKLLTALALTFFCYRKVAAMSHSQPHP